MVTVGTRLRIIRKDAGLSQVELGKLAGSNQSAINRFSHHGSALVECLGRNRQRERDVCSDFTGMEGAFKTAPFKRSAIEHRVQIQCIIACPVVMLVTSVRTAVPFPLQLFHAHIGGQLAYLFQHGFSYLLTPPLYSGFIHIQRLKENILFGIHDRQSIFQALRRMVGGIHMNMHPAAAVDHCSGVAQRANDFLQFAHLVVLQFR